MIFWNKISCLRGLSTVKEWIKCSLFFICFALHTCFLEIDTFVWTVVKFWHTKSPLKVQASVGDRFLGIRWLGVHHYCGGRFSFVSKFTRLIATYNAAIARIILGEAKIRTISAAHGLASTKLIIQNPLDSLRKHFVYPPRFLVSYWRWAGTLWT